jgi:hypothetical protein
MSSKYCRHTGPQTIVRTKIADGSWQVRSECDECHRLFGTAIKQDYLDMESLSDYSQECHNPPCARCGHPDTQLHHYFPQSLARKSGENPDDWPTEYLCSKHHFDVWHRIVTPQLVKARRVTP